MTIAASSTTAAGAFSDIGGQVRAFLDQAQTLSAGGITVSEFGQLLLALLRLASGTLDTMTGMTGAQKREIALQAVASLFDLVAVQAVPLAAYPVWLILRPAVRSAVLALSAGLLEQLLPLVRNQPA
jgi:hypothetical protein